MSRTKKSRGTKAPAAPRPSKPSRRRETTARRGRKTESFEDLARAAVARASVLPSVTDLLDVDQEDAMVEAYIDQYVRPDCKEALRASAKVARGSDDTPKNIVWIKEEIAYALGVEVGRRLVGSAAMTPREEVNNGGDK